MLEWFLIVVIFGIGVFLYWSFLNKQRREEQFENVRVQMDSLLRAVQEVTDGIVARMHSESKDDPDKSFGEKMKKALEDK